MADEIFYEEDPPVTGQNAATGAAGAAAPLDGRVLSSGLDLIRDAAADIAATSYYTLDELTDTGRARGILADIMLKAAAIVNADLKL